MNLEEIERESAKLSQEERAQLAARLVESRDPPVPVSPAGEKSGRVCPSCKKRTKLIEIEVESTDWARVYFIGILAALYPDKQRGRVCEHCGHVFDRTEVTNPVMERLMTFLFFLIPGIVIVGVIVMFVSAMME